MPAGVNSTDGSQRGTSTSLGRRVQPFGSKKARSFSRSSSVFIGYRFRKRSFISQMDHNIGLATRRLGKDTAGPPAARAKRSTHLVQKGKMEVRGDVHG